MNNLFLYMGMKKKKIVVDGKEFTIIDDPIDSNLKMDPVLKKNKEKDTYTIKEIGAKYNIPIRKVDKICTDNKLSYKKETYGVGASRKVFKKEDVEKVFDNCNYKPKKLEEDTLTIGAGTEFLLPDKLNIDGSFENKYYKTTSDLTLYKQCPCKVEKKPEKKKCKHVEIIENLKFVNSLQDKIIKKCQKFFENLKQDIDDLFNDLENI